MNLIMVCLFGAGMTCLMLLSVASYRKATAAKNSAMILARVMTSVVASDDLYARAITPQRLAASPRLQGMLLGTPFVAQIAALLDEAGVSTSVAQVLANTAGSAVGCCLLSLAFGCALPGAIFLGLLVSTSPIFYYKQVRARRIAAFEAQLPQMMEMLTLYLRTGRSLPQAFTAVAEEIGAPASEELALCAEEYRLGRPLPIALKGLAQKYPESLGLKLFSIAISVLGQTGGNLVEVLERIKRTLDSSISYVLKLRSMTGEARTSATILGVLPGLFMLASAFLNPLYFNQFFTNSVGLMLLAAFCGFWVLGVVWLRVLMSSRA